MKQFEIENFYDVRYIDKITYLLYDDIFLFLKTIKKHKTICFVFYSVKRNKNFVVPEYYIGTYFKFDKL